MPSLKDDLKVTFNGVVSPIARVDSNVPPDEELKESETKTYDVKYNGQTRVYKVKDATSTAKPNEKDEAIVDDEYDREADEYNEEDYDEEGYDPEEPDAAIVQEADSPPADTQKDSEHAESELLNEAATQQQREAEERAREKEESENRAREQAAKEAKAKEQ